MTIALSIIAGLAATMTVSMVKDTCRFVSVDDSEIWVEEA
jgi:hypothetical protein